MENKIKGWMNEKDIPRLLNNEVSKIKNTKD